MGTQVHGFAFALDYFFFTTPSDVKLLVWIRDEGCFQPISINVCQMATIYFAVMYSAPSSALAAKYITNLMVWAIMRIAPFHLVVGSFSDKICGLQHGCAPWTRC